MNNPFRKALLERRLTLGAWVQMPHPAIAEIFCDAGFDWVCADLEHGAISIESLADLFRAIDAAGAVPVARLPVNDATWIHRCLDAGARGLIVPMVNSGDAAERAVRESKYPPRGVRGFGYSRANRYGAQFQEYVRFANDEIAMVMQIEHKDAIAAIDDILGVEGVDGVFVGPFDLSGSMGITGQLDHPDMQAALDTYRQACARHGMAAGLHVVHPQADAVRQAVAQGYTLIALGLDTVFLESGAQAALAAAKSAAPERTA